MKVTANQLLNYIGHGGPKTEFRVQKSENVSENRKSIFRSKLMPISVIIGPNEPEKFGHFLGTDFFFIFCCIVLLLHGLRGFSGSACHRFSWLLKAMRDHGVPSSKTGFLYRHYKLKCDKRVNTSVEQNSWSTNDQKMAKA